MKKEGKGEGGRKKVINHTLEYLYEAQMTAENQQKQGRILEEGGIFLAGQNIYPWGRCVGVGQGGALGWCGALFQNPTPVAGPV